MYLFNNSFLVRAQRYEFFAIAAKESQQLLVCQTIKICLVEDYQRERLGYLIRPELRQVMVIARIYKMDAFWGISSYQATDRRRSLGIAIAIRPAQMRAIYPGKIRGVACKCFFLIYIRKIHYHYRLLHIYLATFVYSETKLVRSGENSDCFRGKLSGVGTNS